MFRVPALNWSRRQVRLSQRDVILYTGGSSRDPPGVRGVTEGEDTESELSHSPRVDQNHGQIPGKYRGVPGRQKCYI